MKIRHFCLLSLGMLAALASHAQPVPRELIIDVRSGIDQAEKDKRDHDPAYASNAPHRLRLFFLAHVSEEKSRERLLKPVDARLLAQEVTRQLEAQGFHAVGPNQKHEIIITVKYGRGQLMSNPYLDLDNLLIGDPRRMGQHSNLSDSDRVGPQSHDKYVGLEAKRQEGSLEKLIIQVRA